jgi:hypothetical protein
VNAGEPTVPEVLDMVRSLRQWLDDPRHREDFAQVEVMFDQFAQEFAEVAAACREMSAWCRLGAGLVRGEDVPESIHPKAGEDPADTARWQKWRLS